MAEKESTVHIYGTNLSGYRAAYALAKQGYKTVMLNRGEYVDQYRNQALAQLPLDFCWACGHMPQRLFIGLGAMQVLYNADVLEVSGEAGNFTVKVKKRDPYVANLACTECEACVRACPVTVEGDRKAITVHPEIAWENIFLIDEEHCTKCGECEKVCPTGALKLDRKEETLEIKAGAIVLAPEYDEPVEEDLKPFCFGEAANVVKNSDLARSSLLTNFIRNSLKRPSDGKIPESVAIVVTPQYNQPGVEYESYNTTITAIYRACRTKELLPNTEVVVFMREFRGYGKGHYRWFKKAEDLGVKIVRASELKVEPSGDDVTISYTLGEKEETFKPQLTILVTGQKPPTLMEKLSTIFGVEADEHGFCKVKDLTCGTTNVDGIFAVGEFTSPTGNPETVWEGYGVVTELRKHLGDPNVPPPTAPQLRDVSREEPKVGVFLCSCFGEFEDKIDLKGLAERIGELPDVAHVEIIKGCCTPPTMQETGKRIAESGVNRVVLGVCTPLQKLLKFRRTVMMGGLNPLLAEFVRFREDIIRVHQNKEAMMEKAAALFASAVAKVKKAQAAPPPTAPFGPGALVIGGGAAGLEAALGIANHGFPVTLVEKRENLGGKAVEIETDLEGHNLREYVEKLITEATNHPNITIYTSTQIAQISGYAGHYRAILRREGEDSPIRVEAGVVIVATGAKENRVSAYSLGEDERVITQRDLQRALENGKFNAKSVVMIQCVGSRNQTHPYCSRVCCSQALKNALTLREKGVDVTILFRDMNTYGFKEDYYRKAREAGVKFIRFSGESYPSLDVGDTLTVKVKELETGKEHQLSCEALVLSVGIVPDLEENRRLAQMLDFSLDQEGFFDTDSNACPYEEAIKRLMKPFELSTNGVFAVGMANSPRPLAEALLTAKDAAGKSLVMLPKRQLPPPNAMFVSEVRESKCSGCGLCVEVCPYRARELDPATGVAKVRWYLCDSCGACLVACPSEAAYLRDARGEQMIPSIDALLM